VALRRAIRFTRSPATCGRGEHVGNISPSGMPLLAASRSASRSDGWPARRTGARLSDRPNAEAWVAVVEGLRPLVCEAIARSG
jgi:hypothetical protein